MRDRESLAWAAGFFEGEGCITASKQTGRSGGTQIHMDISQVDIEPLERFRIAVGFGLVRLHQRSPSQRQGHQPIHKWRVTNYEQVQAAVAMLWPWLSTRRREQARKALLAVQAAWVPMRTHCSRGHEYTPENTRIDHYGSRSQRSCRTCARERATRNYAANREGILAYKREWNARKRAA